MTGLVGLLLPLPPGFVPRISTAYILLNKEIMETPPPLRTWKSRKRPNGFPPVLFLSEFFFPNNCFQPFQPFLCQNAQAGTFFWCTKYGFKIFVSPCKPRGSMVISIFWIKNPSSKLKVYGLTPGSLLWSRVWPSLWVVVLGAISAVLQ